MAANVGYTSTFLPEDIRVIKCELPSFISKSLKSKKLTKDIVTKLREYCDKIQIISDKYISIGVKLEFAKLIYQTVYTFIRNTNVEKYILAVRHLLSAMYILAFNTESTEKYVMLTRYYSLLSNLDRKLGNSEEAYLNLFIASTYSRKITNLDIRKSYCEILNPFVVSMCK